MTASNPGKSPDLNVSLAGIEFKNPVLAASGTFGYGVEFEDVVHLSKLGGFVVKGLSKEPMIGNPPPRLWETAAGMLNAIGLQNIGARAFLEVATFDEIEQHVVALVAFRRRRRAHHRNTRAHGIYRRIRICPYAEQVGRHDSLRRSLPRMREGYRRASDSSR